MSLSLQIVFSLNDVYRNGENIVTLPAAAVLPIIAALCVVQRLSPSDTLHGMSVAGGKVVCSFTFICVERALVAEVSLAGIYARSAACAFVGSRTRCLSSIGPTSTTGSNP